MDRNYIKNLIKKENLIDQGRLRELDALTASSGDSLLDTIISGGYIKEENLLPVIAADYGMQWLDLDTLEPEEDLAAVIPDSPVCVPVGREGAKVLIAIPDISYISYMDEMGAKHGWKAEPVLASSAKIRKFAERAQLLTVSRQTADDMLGDFDDGLNEKQLEDMANEAPIIKLVNLIILQAISEGASDIHLEPYENYAVLRYRIDGVLHEVGRYTKAQYPAIVSRIKILSELDIAERRIPQDGRISIKMMEKPYDLRVATVPVLFGEGVVMRILDKGSIMLNLTELGFEEKILKSFMDEIHKPNGIVLVTGPTGSGKTTTLYAALASVMSEESKIITVEDPVEYNLEGVMQIHVNTAVGLTFASGLRSILRLDPDVVMVGEIRDTETAEIAVRAALTGHNVFSTLHTNDSASAVTRLIDMGVAPYLISSSLNAVLAQRLVRKLCSHCKTETPPNEAAMTLLREAGRGDIKTVMTAPGCEDCRKSGYKGRIGIYELLIVNDEIRKLINQKVPAEVIRKKAEENGTVGLRDYAVDLLINGVTSAEEIIRVSRND